MWRLMISHWWTFVILAWLVLLVVGSALQRPEKPRRPVDEIERHFTWKWLAPVPTKLRLFPGKGVGTSGFTCDLLDSFTADWTGRVAEGIKRIRRD